MAQTIEAVERRLSDAVMKPITLAGLADAWRAFAESVRQGYPLTVYDFTNDLGVRDTVEEVLPILSDQDREWLRGLVEPADAAYLAATRPDPERLLSRLYRHGDEWWWNRVPIELGSLAGEYGIYPRDDPRRAVPPSRTVPAPKVRLAQRMGEFGGLPLWGSTRAADMQIFWFGDRVMWRRGQVERETGSVALHVQCAWRIRMRRRILVASSDLEVARSDDSIDERAFEPDQVGTSLRDERIDAFLARGPRLVTAAYATAVGDLEIRLEDTSVIEVFVDRSGGQHESLESWRIIFQAVDRPGLVMTSSGLAPSEDDED